MGWGTQLDHKSFSARNNNNTGGTFMMMMVMMMMITITMTYMIYMILIIIGRAMLATVMTPVRNMETAARDNR